MTFLAMRVSIRHVPASRYLVSWLFARKTLLQIHQNRPKFNPTYTHSGKKWRYAPNVGGPEPPLTGSAHQFGGGWRFPHHPTYGGRTGCCRRAVFRTYGYFTVHKERQRSRSNQGGGANRTHAGAGAGLSHAEGRSRHPR
jgi:hypothetical protein